VIYFGGQIAHTLPFGADRRAGWNWTHWKTVLRPVVEEIGSNSPLYPALIAPPAKLDVKVERAGSARAAGIDFCTRETETEIFLIAARRDRATAQVQFTGLSALPDQTTQLLFEEPRTVALKDGAFVDWFAPFEVHVYRFRK
jgi:hypothetical protein